MSVDVLVTGSNSEYISKYSFMHCHQCAVAMFRLCCGCPTIDMDKSLGAWRGMSQVGSYRVSPGVPPPDGV